MEASFMGSEVESPSWRRSIVSLSTVHSSRTKAGGWLGFELNDVTNPIPQTMSHAMIDATAWYQGCIRKPGKCLCCLTGRTGHIEISFRLWNFSLNRVVVTVPSTSTNAPYFNFHYGNLTLKPCYESVWRAEVAWGPISTLNMGT